MSKQTSPQPQAFEVTGPLYAVTITFSGARNIRYTVGTAEVVSEWAARYGVMLWTDEAEIRLSPDMPLSVASVDIENVG